MRIQGNGVGYLYVAGMVLGAVISDTLAQNIMEGYFQPLFIMLLSAIVQFLWLPFYRNIEWPSEGINKHIFVLAILWFLANYLNLYSLHYTSLSSNEVLTTMMAPWALFLSVLLMPKERHCIIFKSLAILLCLFGTLVIARSDNEQEQSRGMGDICILLSALSYGTFDVYLRYNFPENIDLRGIMVIMGAIVSIVMIPGIFISDLIGFETFHAPNLEQFAGLSLVVLTGSFLAEYCMVKAVMILSPFVASIGITLNVPISIMIDLVVNSLTLKWSFGIGATLCLGGFALVSSLEVPSVQAKLDDSNILRCKRNLNSYQAFELSDVNPHLINNSVI